MDFVSKILKLITLKFIKMKSEVHNIDCLEFMRGLPDKSFDLVIADPPYGINAGTKENTAFHKNSRIAKYGQLSTVNDYKPTKDFFDEIKRVSKNQIIWGWNHLSDMLPPTKEFIFWYKHQPVVTYADGELAWTSFNKTAKCFDLPYFGTLNADNIRIHPTQKPIVLYAWILKTYGGGCKTIFDPMMGSQSSRIACWKMGFDFVGCELDKEYFEKGCERFNRECKGEIKTKDGNIIKQLSLF